MGLFNWGKNMPENFEDRRKYTRLKKNFILNYFELGTPTKKYEVSQLRNISLGGICLITPHAFPTGTMLGFCIKTPYLIEMTCLEGQVLGSHEKVKDIIYETRVEFKNLSPDATAALNAIIGHFLKDEK